MARLVVLDRALQVVLALAAHALRVRRSEVVVRAALRT
jgi:hypothetical protein